jgi:hypothetical protein
MKSLKAQARRIFLESLGWLLIAAGIAALVLPGPGLLAIFAGLALLATQYDWAERRVEPVRKAAYRAAEESVKSWPRIFLTVLFTLVLGALGILWGSRPPAPEWWPLAEKWWLVGGWGTGGVMLASSLFALAMVAVSYIKFKPRDKA